MSIVKYVYCFGRGRADGDASIASKNILGGKGANLAQMCLLNVPVPPGFTVTSDVCAHYYKHRAYLKSLSCEDVEKVGNINEASCTEWPLGYQEQLKTAIEQLEHETGRKFANLHKPLLVSVRSGARVSMPGMMDTVLNLGMNQKVVQGMLEGVYKDNKRFVWDSYRRFLSMFGEVVLRVPSSMFDSKLQELKVYHGAQNDYELSPDALCKLSADYLAIIEYHTDKDFPQDPYVQLALCVQAVFRSWMNNRAITYRRLHNYSDCWGTAVTVQAMVFGNMDNQSATGVTFTRDPSTGANTFYGEYMINAQGEDIVAGIRTPSPLVTQDETTSSQGRSMQVHMPETFKQLIDVSRSLELFYKNMQEIEFTVESGKLYILQTRDGKRSVKANVEMVVSMHNEGVLSKEEALLSVPAESLEKILHPRIVSEQPRHLLGVGLAASPGAVSGKIVFTADEAEICAQSGMDVILCRVETSPEDIHGMHAAKAVLTSRGGKTSHAAVVARGLGKPCVCGAESITIQAKNKVLITSKGERLEEYQEITLDGSTGEVLMGKLQTHMEALSPSFWTLMNWSDQMRTMGVKANAETPSECRMAVELHAQGIGLCRTEHMFFEPSRLRAVRAMILAQTRKEEAYVLEQIEPMQRGDFIQIFEILDGMPVAIRLLDPPLHEFLPRPEQMEDVAEDMNISLMALQEMVEPLREANPMLGHRGCRLGITHPQIYRMQLQAIFKAARIVLENGGKVQPEIMIPLVMDQREIIHIKDMICQEYDKIFGSGTRLEYKVGTMIELPRACMVADEIARHVDFFSFGTNDLTQTGFGLSRDDNEQTLRIYQRNNILSFDPFSQIDRVGVGELMRIAVQKGRQTNPDLSVSICGEHGGDPDSIEFCQQLGIDYVSCSPPRLPTARLAAAQVAMKQRHG